MIRNELDNVENISVGDLVEYKYPLPEHQKIFGVVLRMRKIEANVYERGFIEADVRWTHQRWRNTYSALGSLYETHEDISRLSKLSS